MVFDMARKPTAKRAVGGARRPRGTGASYVHEQLKNRILHLELMPGTLLDETEISRQFGVSRSPVREALIRLSAEGLVQNFRNRTAIVAQFDIASLPSYFDAMQLLYRLSARLASQNPNPAKLEKLRRDHEEHERALRRRDIRNMVRFNREFHMTIAEMGGNPYVLTWMSGLLDQGQRLLGLYGMHLPDRVSGDFLKAHRDIMAAIAKKDADAAEAAGRADAQSLIDEFMESLANRPGMRFSFK
jgi:DNA-binding GntR family transcriptional regulator